eukprot:jgi/Ulvmu1/848/UM010_0222.1
MAISNLLIVCGLMLVGPMVTGVIPLAVSASGDWLKWMQLLGAGVMLSCALAVVLPEGFNALHTSKHLDTSDRNGNERTEEDPLLSRVDHDHQHSSDVPHWMPGSALLAGFLMMVLFQFAHHKHKAADGGMSTTIHDPLLDCSKAPCGLSPLHAGVSSQDPDDSASSVLIALIIHSVADGLAVGIASLSKSIRLAVSIGFAMVLHKGPVAFGLTAFLFGKRESSAAVLRVGSPLVHPQMAHACSVAGAVWQRDAAIDFLLRLQDLIIFTLASPTAALVSYFVLRPFSGSASDKFVAVCVLFSAGTFIYAAAVHMLPDFSGKDHSLGDVGVLCIGAAVPCLINLVHMLDH